MHPNVETFSIEITTSPNEVANEEFQKAMDALHDSYVSIIKQLAEELNVSDVCATDIWYLRSRSRWSQALESKLIELHKAGTPPNIGEFGC